MRLREFPFTPHDIGTRLTQYTTSRHSKHRFMLRSGAHFAQLLHRVVLGSTCTSGCSAQSSEHDEVGEGVAEDIFAEDVSRLGGVIVMIQRPAYRSGNSIYTHHH